MVKQAERHPLLGVLAQHGEYLRLREALDKEKGPCGVFGLTEGNRSHMAATLFADLGRPMLIIVPSENAAEKMSQEISSFLPAQHFPARDVPLTGEYASSDGIEARRVAALCRLAGGDSPMILCASMEAVMQRLAPPDAFLSRIYRVNVGDVVSPQELLSRLLAAGYTRAEVCESRGQACLRGGYLDVFPTAAENPVRIEFFDDEVDTLRTYDPLTQRSIENIQEARFLPAVEMPILDGARKRAIKALSRRPACSELLEALRSGGTPGEAVRLLPLFYPESCTLLDYFQDGILLLDEPARLEESAKMLHMQYVEQCAAAIAAGEAQGEQAELLKGPLETIKAMDTPRTALFFSLTRSYGLIGTKEPFHFETRPISRYVGDATLLCEDLAAWRREGTTVLIYGGTHAERLRQRLEDMDTTLPAVESLDRPFVKGEQIILGQSLERGFSYSELGLAVISERELYGDVSRAPKRAARKRPQLVFSELNVGDLVVHELHGIGRFVGVVTLTVDGAPRDYLHLVYAGGDKLYIPTDQLDRVQKYIGGKEEEGLSARLSKLGSGEWQRTVSKTREGVRKLAFDLVRLYGERQRLKGFAFAPDDPWQKRLEDSFPYEETPDQLTCIQEIKADMESDRVMDRLLCGDVGYGKTEVALRAAFKAVLSGKQVAMLVPTTILAQQHYNTIAARFSGFPVQVALLSRFKTPSEQEKILEGIKGGQVDMVIGTHKLLAPSVKFKDLGLLIIDEEQRFGVGHKEQIKNLKRNIDVLSLSATPIPRTLHMSMTGIRDMSVLETPPAQRYPVQTYVMEYAEGIVREAIRKELGRGGQVYFLYNNVRTMEYFAQYLRDLVPEARIAFAHGQMSERILEKTMLDFLDRQYDVLLCSTIIENGLDMPNANTILIYDADKMGLAQLYQLRGRVGRSVRLGYAYLFFRRNKSLSEIAEKRLMAIREFTQFGSGFRIAMRDLEIRGAGNLLGPEQSGHMEAVGYDLYCKIVESALREAKGEPPKKEIDTVMELPLAASIPHSYIPRESERLSMYKRIAHISSQEELYDVQDELIDRYGDIPKPVENLLFIGKLKSDAQRAYITRLHVRDGEARIHLDAQAPMDGTKLYQIVHKIEGAQFKPGDPTTLLLHRPKQSAAAFCAALPQIVYMLADCIQSTT